MKKLLYLFTMLALFVACSDDDDKNNDTPIKGLDVPVLENPVKPGESITIKGEGFTAESEIWFRAIATRAENEGDVRATVTEVNPSGITFIAPAVYGNQAVLLKENGKEYELGKMTFEEEPEQPAEVEILPKKIKKVLEYEGENPKADVREYTYYEDGKIKSCKSFEYTYSDDKITVKSKYEESIFSLENGLIQSYVYTDLHDNGFRKYALKYDGDYLSIVESTHQDEDNNYSETETFVFSEGNLTKYSCFSGDIEGKVELTYSNQLNNLNIDMFYFIGEYNCFDSDIAEVFQFGYTGKRSQLLPDKLELTGPEWDEDEEEIIGTETYTVSIAYQMTGDYITKITFTNEKTKRVEWTYEIEYEE